MRLRSTNESWGNIAVGFHWLVALLIVALSALGWVAANWHLSPTKISLFMWHKSIGLIVLGLVVLRLLWRTLDRHPAFPLDMSCTEQRLATAVHCTLYACMFAMPISGWVINSAAGFPFKLFGLWPVPDIAAPNESLQEGAELVHLSLFWLLAGTVGLHVLAALRHHFIKRNSVLLRMLPGYRRADENAVKCSR